MKGTSAWAVRCGRRGVACCLGDIMRDNIRGGGRGCRGVTGAQ